MVAAPGKKEVNTRPGLPVRAAVGKSGVRIRGVMVEDGWSVHGNEGTRADGSWWKMDGAFVDDRGGSSLSCDRHRFAEGVSLRGRASVVQECSYTRHARIEGWHGKRVNYQVMGM